MANKILEMRSITKKFPGVVALDQVSLDINDGEILAICGENGAGKSTLMKVLSGSYPYTSYDGEIWINGAKKMFRSPGDSEKEGIAMIYQEISMHLDCSVAENLFLGHLFTRGKYFIDWRKIYGEARTCLERIGLENLNLKESGNPV